MTDLAPAPIVRLSHVVKTYDDDGLEVTAINDVSFEIGRQRFAMIVGPSGSGKTTLLNLIGCIDTASAGKVEVCGEDVAALADNALTDFRSRNIAFVFQNFNLFPVLSAYENVEYPLLLLGLGARERRERTLALLSSVGLTDQARHRPNQLSGGQKQRVAIARALLADAPIILLDEATSALDTESETAVQEALSELMRGRTILAVAHRLSTIGGFDRVIVVEGGRIVEDGTPEELRRRGGLFARLWQAQTDETPRHPANEDEGSADEESCSIPNKLRARG